MIFSFIDPQEDLATQLSLKTCISKVRIVFLSPWWQDLHPPVGVWASVGARRVSLKSFSPRHICRQDVVVKPERVHRGSSNLVMWQWTTFLQLKKESQRLLVYKSECNGAVMGPTSWGSRDARRDRRGSIWAEPAQGLVNVLMSTRVPRMDEKRRSDSSQRCREEKTKADLLSLGPPDQKPATEQAEGHRGEKPEESWEEKHEMF